MTRAQKWLLRGAAALVVVVNALLLAGVAWNRSGAPDSTLTLGTRELTVPWNFGRDGERGGVTLMLNWRALSAHDDAQGHYSHYAGYGPHWLDEAKLRALGFDLSGDRDGERPPRELHVVLEFAGEAWQRAQARAREHLERARARGSDNEQDAAALKSAQQALESELHRASRLFAIDAGADATALRQRYPDTRRFAIVRATVKANAIVVDGRDTWQGRIGELAVSAVSVPYALRGPLSGAGLEDWRNERAGFEIDVSWGRRLEPWITAVRAMPRRDGS